MKSKSLQEYAEAVNIALEKLKFELGNALKIDALLCKSNKLLSQRLNKVRFLEKYNFRRVYAEGRRY